MNTQLLIGRVCQVCARSELPLLAADPTPLEQGVEISLKTLQIIYNPFGVNAC
jgi:hypothetical protein